MATETAPKTLREAILFFADSHNCRKAIQAIRWPDGTVCCPRCGSEHVTYLEKAHVWKCYEKHPKAKFSLKVGTIFEDSAIGFEKWLPALWLLTNCKNGISSYELARALGVTQKTAWFMLSRLRLALQGGSSRKLKGHVEVDETFIGGKRGNMHVGRQKFLKRGGTGGKVAVMGLLERNTATKHSRVKLHIVTSIKRGPLQDKVRQHVEAGSSLYTDAFLSYVGLSRDYLHQFIDHSEAYVEGVVHTNGLENFWSLLKRAIKGTYVSVEPFHLFRYLDEQAFRFNHRKGTDAMRFALALKGIIGKRLTYNALTGSELPQTC